ncbi:glycosyl hydrolases family 31-domain-containing protein [Thamnocephalis sphaerospora]|uniref:Glucosidase II subunit alpha n=1 Tax=Thamnocephalis sphaerospora TaxID=78915 RepID=A0A4P9XID3_9FUNG|nr:glycosyl hydrolases family 31-domain-containing protein [Thamnocephalis sphaerospora]|eukprot:RKP05444.1 glycosyl hydrolases family 31-domain-containing protein [Thamnocephalis sphaerospora]
MALYGSVPVMLGHRKPGHTAGVFWLNLAETWVDVVKEPVNEAQLDGSVDGHLGTSSRTHWISESGVLDVFLLPGPQPVDVYKQYGLLTGTLAMPPAFSIAYHQCRWNYLNQEDVLQVDANFDKHDIPYDVIWLDIEHTVERRYFTWDSTKFPDPVVMQKSLASRARKVGKG